MIGYAQFVSFILLFSLAFHGQDPKKLLKLEAKFQDQKGAVNQAKVLGKLLPREVQMAAEEIRQGDVNQGVARLEHWGNRAKQVHEALIATGRNPVKKPAGFRQLQVALRESLRGLRDLVFYLPLGHRHRVESVQTDLSHVNKQLLEELFPPPSPPERTKK